MTTTAGPIVRVASAARTTSGASGALQPTELGAVLTLLVNVTAASGTTPTLDLKVQWSHDGGTTWADGDPADTFTQITATGAKVKNFAMKAPIYQVVWTIGGTTPSFTFSVSRFQIAD